MQWWNSFVAWFTASSTVPVIAGALVLVIAFALGSAVSAWIARSSIRRLLAQRDRELKAAAIGALVDAATEASVWNSLTPQEQVMVDRAVGQADMQLRLLPLKGAAVAANWAAHQLAEFKRTSATFGYQLEPSVLEFRDRLLEWQKKPGRARKFFQSDLDRWRVPEAGLAPGLLAEQDSWVAKQHHEQFAPVDQPAPVQRPFVPGQSPASTETEAHRLLDDVEALDVRPAETVALQPPSGEPAPAPRA